MDRVKLPLGVLFDILLRILEESPSHSKLAMQAERIFEVATRVLKSATAFRFLTVILVWCFDVLVAPA